MRALYRAHRAAVGTPLGTGQDDEIPHSRYDLAAYYAGILAGEVPCPAWAAPHVPVPKPPLTPPRRG